MKLSDVIKTKNGLAFLSQNLHLIRLDANRLSDDIPYDKDVVYEENDFSYKKHVREFPKQFGTEFVEVIGNVKNDYIRNFLLGGIIPFDGDFISIDSCNNVTFRPYNKPSDKGRQSMSTYKFLIKVFKDNANVTEQQVKQAGDQICSANSEYYIEFVSGKKISENYAEINCDEWETTSCMSEQDTDWFRIYDDNPDVCELGLIKRKDTNEIVGRFLKWKADCGSIIADRLYYKTGVVQEWFNDWCDADEIYRRDSDDYSTFYYHGEENYSMKFKVTLCYDVDSYDSLPYFDTFRYTDGDKEINNSIGNYTLENSEGAGLSKVFDEIDNCYIDEDDAVYVEYGDEHENRGSFWTHVDNTVEIDLGEGKGYRALESDCFWSDTNDAYVLK